MNSPFPALQPAADHHPMARPEEADGIDARALVAMFYRRWKLFAAVVIAVFALAVIYTARENPVYTATASVLIDTQKLQLFSPNATQSLDAGASPDSNAVDTQVEVMRSRAIADWVAQSLNLDQDPAFRPRRGGGGLGALLARSNPANNKPQTLSAAAIHKQVIDNLLGPLDVRRVGTSYIIQLSYTNGSAAKAAAIANAFAQGYLVDSVATKSAVTREASGLLSSRLVELGNSAAQDNAAVQQYKIAHGLMSASGTTLTEQEISNYNQQLANAKAEAAEDRARLNTAQAQLAHGSTGEDVGEALNSPVIQSLRAQRALASAQVAALSGRYGPRYPDMIKAQGQLADIDAEIRQEIERVISNLQAKADVSRQRVASVTQTLGEAQGTLAVNNRAQVGLTQLEQKASASQALYDAYLNRFKETSTQEGTEQSGARIVSRADVPTVQSAPKVGLNLAFGAILALGAGLASVLMAEVFDNGLRTADDVERRLGIPYLGGIPILRTAAPGAKDTPADYVVAHPMSMFTETFRSLRASVLMSNAGDPPRVIAITSALAGEGKTTLAVCLGLTAAIQGSKCVVVDCDLRRRAVSRHLPEAPPRGLIEVLRGEATLDEALYHEQRSGAAFLALADGARTTDDVFNGQSMDLLLGELKSRFDLVILDTPPILAVADARLLAAKADATVLLARWRQTPQQAVRAALRQLETGGVRLAGAALSLVDMRQQARYDYGDPAYYFGQHMKYFES
jgi:capsular exopolysaccharide synthesis family protein